MTFIEARDSLIRQVAVLLKAVSTNLHQYTHDPTSSLRGQIGQYDSITSSYLLLGKLTLFLRFLRTRCVPANLKVTIDVMDLLNEAVRKNDPDMAINVQFNQQGDLRLVENPKNINVSPFIRAYGNPGIVTQGPFVPVDQDAIRELMEEMSKAKFEQAKQASHIGIDLATPEPDQTAIQQYQREFLGTSAFNK